MTSLRRRIRATAIVTALSVVATGTGLPPAAIAQSPAASPAVTLPDLRVPGDGTRSSDGALDVPDGPTRQAAPVDPDAVIDDAFATADALPEAAWEIGALAETLGRDPAAAFHLVRDRIRFEPYPGVLRGAEGTLAARAGNAWDRALLLRALLASMDVPARFAFGELDEATARTLAARALDPATDPLPAAGALAATTIDLDALAARARRDYARLRSALDDARVTVDGASSEDLTAELLSHVWVQVEQDGSWVDLDPSLPDAEPGLALTEASSVDDALPAEAFQTITLRVSVEHLADAGLPERVDVLERRLDASEAARAEVFLYFVPDTGGGGLLGGTSTDTFLPQLMVDRESQGGTGFSVAAEGGGDDFFGLGGGAGPAFVGAWLTITREAPGREPVATTIELLDRVPDGTDRSAANVNELEPLATTEAGPAALAGIHHVLVSTGGTNPRQAAIDRAVAVAFASTELLAPDAADLPLGDLLWPVAVADEQLATISEHVLVPSLADPGSIAPVIDRPRVSVLSLGPDGSDPTRVDTSIDLAADEVRLLAGEGVAPQAIADRRMWYGALESALETETLLRSAGWGMPDGMTLEGASLSMDQPLTVLTDPAALPAGATASLAGALASGLVAVVPGDPASATTWWTVDTADGSTRAIVAPGLGGAVASRPERRATHDVQGGWTPGGGGYVNSAQSGVRYVINPQTLNTDGVIRNGRFYRTPRPAPNARTCSGGNEYSALLGCVSIPMALVIGTVTAVITMWAVSRCIRALR